MKKNMITIALGVVAVMMMTTVVDLRAYAMTGDGRGEAAQKAPAPDFALTSVSGKTVSLKDFKGKNVILFFFATWCPYCREKIPGLTQNYALYQSQWIDVVLIDAGESQQKVESFAKKQGLSFDILLDKDSKVSESYGVMGIPTFVLINKEGMIVDEDNELPGNYQDLLMK